MKSFLPALLLLAFPFFINAQNIPGRPLPQFQLGTYIGYSAMTGLNKNLDLRGSRMFGINMQYTIHLAQNNYYLSIGAGYESNRYNVDGLFSKNGNNYSFDQTPDNYKQHQLSMEYLQFPVLFKFKAFKASSTGIGPYVGYLLNADSHYKIGSENFRADAPIQNKFRAGIAFEQEFLLLNMGKSKLVPILGYGLQYQLTRNLQEGNSFKPLTGFIKLGIGF